MFKLKILLLNATLAAALGFTAIACAVQKSPDKQSLTQGIEGYVIKLSGNRMPMKGRQPALGAKGIKREVWIYQAATVRQAHGRLPLLTKVSAPLAIKVLTDSMGHFRAALPAGFYSLFVKEGDNLFAAETDGRGILNPTEVFTGKITNRNITVAVAALY